jgi:hypothetical protein
LDENGRFVDKPMTVRMVQWQPFCAKKPFDPKTPVCAACKRTNRTRSFCRERHKHRQLPWCSVYVLLSTLESADPSTVVAGASRRVDDDESSATGETPKGASPASEVKVKTSESDTITSDEGDTGDDINDIAESRTFLAKVSCRSSSIHWLELADFDGTDHAVYADSMQQHYAMIPGMHLDPNAVAHMAYGYQPNMYAQQHQNALKSRQQYFFQMQQQQQQPFPPPGPPMGQWQQAAYMVPPQGQVEPTGVTAGEAAAQQRRGHAGSPDEAAQPPPNHQHWATMYYQGPSSAGGGLYAPHHLDTNGQVHAPALDGAVCDDSHVQYHTPPETAEEGDESEEPDLKKRRV